MGSAEWTTWRTDPSSERSRAGGVLFMDAKTNILTSALAYDVFGISAIRSYGGPRKNDVDARYIDTSSHVRDIVTSLLVRVEWFDDKHVSCFDVFIGTVVYSKYPK